MSGWGWIHLGLGLLLARQFGVTLAVLRSRHWLRRATPVPPKARHGRTLQFFLIVPVLREACGLGETVRHLREVAAGHQARIVIVTSARERTESHLYPEAADTICLADSLAESDDVCHLHHPDPQAVKADQVNLAARHCLTELGGAADGAFIVVYDADSRPPVDSLGRFAEAIATHPEAHVFHQSSRFTVRSAAHRPPGALRRALVECGALRANRFVLAYEIPRLRNRVDPTPRWKRRLCSGVYAHVTGHGLCLRLSSVADLPLPAGSPLEDMHYSFVLCSRDEPMVPIPSLDAAEVPETVGEQFEQLTRWVAGPARFRRYLADPATDRGWRAWALAGSAALITCGWLSCAALPSALVFSLVFGGPQTRTLIAILVAVYAGQLAIVDQTLGPATAATDRLARLLAYPVTCTAFGLAGVIGTIRLLRGGDGAGKTERRSP